MKRKSSQGFTLIELMIAIAILGIIAAIALPSYQDSVRKSRRTAATVALTTAAQNLERYFTVNNTYTGATVGTEGAATDVLVNYAPIDGAASAAFYEISLAIGETGTSYTITATPTRVMDGDECGNYTLTQTGAKGVSSKTRTVRECW